jgi:glutathione synthase/RimK-type ligase-like ATP-grasp enzyme
LATPGWRQDAAPGTRGAAIRTSWINLLVAIAAGLGVEWLTPLDVLTAAENKVFQLLAAWRLGVQTPKTVIASSRDRIPAELGDPLVVKPLGPGGFRGLKDEMQVVHAQTVERSSSVLNSLAGCPFLLQERLEPEHHLRVVTVGERIWVCSLDAKGLPLDWRRDARAHRSFQWTDGFPKVAEDALRLARKLAVGYTSQDWLERGSSRWFLDLNPGGQWLFLPSPVREQVTDAIVDWLTDEP